VAPTLADLNGDGISDLIVADSGGNNVTVYLMQGSGPPVIRSFFAGTNPVAVRVAQLNDDNGNGKVDPGDTPDLIVVNRGSNDVSILLGKGQGDAWTLTPGPRLLVGNGPMAVDLVDMVT